VFLGDGYYLGRWLRHFGVARLTIRTAEQIGDGNPIPVVSWIDSQSSNL